MKGMIRLITPSCGVKEKMKCYQPCPYSLAWKKTNKGSWRYAKDIVSEIHEIFKNIKSKTRFTRANI